ncbi:MAG: DJ-1/PfpI family protein [Acidobacteria bacterium]|nr:DJ-1/PfpI family protein [Acidobacteriota bacterium]
MPFDVGFVVFPRLTLLDLAGPYEVFGRVPEARLHLIARDRRPVRSEHGLTIEPTAIFAEAPALDLLCAPGGPGVNAALDDEATLDFLAQAGAGARYVTSVCTGSLLLGAAGLLVGKRAACHWASRQFLTMLGAIPVAERVVVDGATITGGGVTAGIDFALRAVAEIFGEPTAQGIQLMMEYAPAPPFESGTPETAPAPVLEAVRDRLRAQQADREERLARLAAHRKIVPHERGAAGLE